MHVEILALLGLFAANGLLAMSEIALVSARRGRLQALVERGDRGAAAALRLHEDPTRFLSTVQVGITGVGILSGIVGEAALAVPLATVLVSAGLDPRAASAAATAVVVVVVTYFAIVLGELVPKRVGQSAPEAVARRVARPVTWLAAATKPFVALLSVSTELLLRLAPARSAGSPVTEDDIHALVAEGAAAGVLAEREGAMVRNVLRLDDRTAASLMTPRPDLTFLNLEEGPQTSLQRVLESNHMHFPVLRGEHGDVVGILNGRRLLHRLQGGGTLDLTADLEEPVIVPETMNGFEVLDRLRTTAASRAVVLGEYGELAGIITPHDLLQAIAGQMVGPAHEDVWAFRRDDGTWLLDGLIPTSELKVRLGLDGLPAEGQGRYNTLAGMLMLLLGRVPRTGDVATWGGWRLEVVDMDANRVDKVLAVAQTPGEEPRRA